LLSLGLLSPRAVVTDGLEVVDASRRNAVYVATVRGGPTLVVKQAVDRNASLLAHEAAVLLALARSVHLSDQIPAVVHYDPATACLVLKTPAGARDWSAHHGAGRFPRMPARALGRALAELHSLPAGIIDDLPRGTDPIWGLSLCEPPHRLLLDLSAGAQDLVARLQTSRVMCDRLDRLRATSPGNVVTHGDLRWDNCLAVPAAGSRRTRVLLVDWELAGYGRPEFDVGAVLAEYLRVWVGSIPIVDPRHPGGLTSRAAHPLRQMQPAIEAFWSAYRAANLLAPPLPRVVEWAAVRMLQTAIESAQGLAAASAHVVTLMQLAANLLRDPDDAAISLLGLRT
jgi:aminoglycoside phosphotransferase (APT) family kinase protein